MLSGLRHRFQDDLDMLHDIMWAKSQFEAFFSERYTLASATSSSGASQSIHRCDTIDLIGSFGDSQASLLSPQDELERFFTLLPVPYTDCNPIQWWEARRSDFPNLARFARDIFSIPGTLATTSFLKFVSDCEPTQVLRLRLNESSAGAET
jgi:hypothetical protein